MALLSSSRIAACPTGTRTLLPRALVSGTAMKAASSGLLNTQLAKAGDQRCEQA